LSYAHKQATLNATELHLGTFGLYPAGFRLQQAPAGPSRLQQAPVSQRACVRLPTFCSDSFARHIFLMTKARISTPTLTPRPTTAFAPVDSPFGTRIGVADEVSVGVDLVIAAEIEEDVVVVVEIAGPILAARKPGYIVSPEPTEISN
jgi:hypothetical protein